MAPERNQRRGGSALPGMRDSDPFAGADGPSRAEVQRRIDSLYNRAETDSRTFNATRAMTLGTSSSRVRATRPPSGGGRGGSDPALDSVARQWFDVARGALGPTVAAALPPDRLPGRSPAALPGRPDRRPDYSDTVRELEAAARPVLELTADAAPEPLALPPAERTAVLPELTAVLPELTAAAPELPPAAPEPALPASAALWPEAGTVMAPGIPAQPAPAEPALTQPVAVQPSPVMPFPVPPTVAPDPVPAVSWPTPAATAAPRPGSPAKPSRSSKGPAKERNRLKLTAARQLLARRTARLAPQAPAAPDLPPPPAPAPPAAAAPVAQPGVPAPTGPGGQWPSPLASHGTAGYAAPPVTADPGPATGGFPTVLPPATTGPLPVVPPTAAASPATPQLPLVPDPLQGPASLGKAAAALAFARAQIGRPCLSGAAGPEAYDCGGLTQAAWRAAGVALPRTAQEQAGAGTPIALTELQPGDLLFFYEGSSHVGLVTGAGTMIHAPGPGASVREDSVFFAGPQAIQGATRPV